MPLLQELLQHMKYAQEWRSRLVLTREFYLREANTVAPELLGKLLVHKTDQGITAGMIVEVESYIGPEDKGSHAYLNKRTERTEIQYGQGGYAYIYSIYGLHFCFNVVTNKETKPEVVLVRALEPVQGIEIMRERRGTEKIRDLCNGPGKLCQAMAITKEQYGCDLCSSEIYLEPYLELNDSQIMTSPRINIDYAEECKDYMWRYFIKDNQYVSKVAKKYRVDLQKNKSTFTN